MATTSDSNNSFQRNYFFAQWLYHYSPEQLKLIRNSGLIPRLQVMDKNPDVILDLLNLLQGTTHTCIYKKYDTYEDCFNNDFEFNFERLDILYAYTGLLNMSYNIDYIFFSLNKTTMIYRIFNTYINSISNRHALFTQLFKNIVFARSSEIDAEIHYTAYDGFGFKRVSNFNFDSIIWDFSIVQGKSL